MSLQLMSLDRMYKTRTKASRNLLPAPQLRLLLLFCLVAFQKCGALQPVTIVRQRSMRNAQQLYSRTTESAFAATHSNNEVSSTLSRPVEQTDENSSAASDSAKRNILAHSLFLGDLYRIRQPGDDHNSSYLNTMNVPVFAAVYPNKNESVRSLEQLCGGRKTVPPCSRGLEVALGNHGPVFVLDQVLSPQACEDVINSCEKLGFASYQAGKNFHGAMQIVVDHAVCQMLTQRLRRHVDLELLQERRQEMEEFQINKNEQKSNNCAKNRPVCLELCGLNRRWRIYRYESGGEERFAPHIDAGFPPSGLNEDGTALVWDTNDDSIEAVSSSSDEHIVSRLTVLLYLNDDFVGGETKFYQPLRTRITNAETSNQECYVIASVRPIAGSCLVFPQAVGEAAVEYARQHWPLHEGSAVAFGQPKYVIRSDILFRTQRQ